MGNSALDQLERRVMVLEGSRDTLVRLAADLMSEHGGDKLLELEQLARDKHDHERSQEDY